MDPRLCTNTPLEWVQKTDIGDYARRQAQSCTYLETLFNEVGNRATTHKSELSDLFAYLRLVHRRQYNDLEEVTEIPTVDDRKSFYFDNVYSAVGLSTTKLPMQLDEENLLSILLIQAVSYLRGQDRYRLLKEYTGTGNESFKEIWTKFYNDATGNAAKIFSFVYGHFATSNVEAKIEEVIKAEDDVIRRIWRHKDVTPS